ncbi:MAG: S8 family serine peptidase [Candidatus Dormibacteria bacterium]
MDGGALSPRRTRTFAVAALSVLLCLPLTLSESWAARATANDPQLVSGAQWALTGAPASINAPAAWCVSSGAGVLVADIDTGADFSHPDLAGKLIAGGRFTNGDGSPAAGGVGDDNGHGTMTTGLMVANTNNGIGIAAVAPGARALIVKVLNSDGSGSPADVAAGIRYALNYRGPGGERVRVINLSIGGDTPALLNTVLAGTPLAAGTEVQDAITSAAAGDVAVVAAAGNGGDGLLSPNDYGRLSGIALVAGAVGRNGARAFYSTNGNIFAPGGDSMGGRDAQHEITATTLGGGYGIAQGTSFAAPHVAGAVALLMGTGRYSAASARQQILSTAAAREGLAELDAGAALGAAGSCVPSGAAVATTARHTTPTHRATARHTATRRR